MAPSLLLMLYLCGSTEIHVGLKCAFMCSSFSFHSCVELAYICACICIKTTKSWQQSTFLWWSYQLLSSLGRLSISSGLVNIQCILSKGFKNLTTEEMTWILPVFYILFKWLYCFMYTLERSAFFFFTWSQATTMNRKISNMVPCSTNMHNGKTLYHYHNLYHK